MAAAAASGLALYAALIAIGASLGAPLLPLVLGAAALTLPVLLWAVARTLRPIRRTVQALTDGIRSFHDGDFGVRLATARRDELGELLRLYNKIGETLQAERTALRQRELLLQTAFEHSPVAIVLVNPLGRVIHANPEARLLFVGGGHLVGLSFEEVLARCPSEMRETLDGGTDGLFVTDSQGSAETYHVARRSFSLNRLPHTLYLLRRLTAELGRQEAEIWKRVIRVISHELNNSLAPIASLAHSARIAADRPNATELLEPIYASIRERVDYLTRFLEGYARFARLPRPQKQPVAWSRWLEQARKLYAFEVEGELPATAGYFDPSQLQQVLINLVKNALEATEDGAPVNVRVARAADGGTFLQVLDRGHGMSDEVLRKALLPFYSTKPSGTGVGLPLCREIVEAHGGKLRIQSRPGGGTVVSLWLPPA